MLVIGSHCHAPGFGAGFFGVDIFFVLSGFLITQLLVDEFEAHGTIDLTGFYLRRFLRLAPPLLLLLAVYVTIGPWAWPQFEPWEHLRDAGLTGFYLSDYARAFWHDPRVLMHTWSLSVEEHFYLIWPIAILVLARIEPRWRMASLVGIYLLATVWRIFEYGHSDWAAVYFRFDTHMSGLVAGALLALGVSQIARISEERANAIGLFACAALVPCLATTFWHAPWALVWMMSLAEIAAVGLLVAASVHGTWVNLALSARPLVAVGTVSYGLYLWHYPVAVFFRDLLPWYQTVPIVLTIAFAAATASYLALERPLRRYRRNLSNRRRATEPAAIA